MIHASAETTRDAREPPLVSGSATRFLIVAAPRTGSNLLCTFLDSHPDVLCHHELFNPDGIFYALPLRDSEFTLGTIDDRTRDPLGFAARVWKVPLGRRCVGFKMTRGQEPAVLDALLADGATRTIVLRRANRVKTYVSELRAQASGQWEVYERDILAASRPRVRVEPAGLRSNIAENDLFYAAVESRLTQFGTPALPVMYERLFAEAEQRRILAFLGIQSTGVPLTARSVKQNSRDLRALIENFDELAVAVRGTDLEAELMDGGE